MKVYHKKILFMLFSYPLVILILWFPLVYLMYKKGLYNPTGSALSLILMFIVVISICAMFYIRGKRNEE